MKLEEFIRLFTLENRVQMGDLQASVFESSRALKDGAYDANLVYPRARELAQGMEVYVVDEQLEDIKEYQRPEEKPGQLG